MIALTLAVLAGFISVLIGVPYARKFLLSSGIYGIDQQKKDKPRLATSGGIVVLFGFLLSITLYTGILSYITPGAVDAALIFAGLSSVNIIALIGLLDDVHIDLESLISEHSDATDVEVDLVEEVRLPGMTVFTKLTGDFIDSDSEDIHRQGLSQIPKMLFVLPATLPLIAVGAGSWTMTVPIIEFTVNWGVLYPLFIIPLMLLFVANVVNMLAGTNGLSTGMSAIAATALGLFAAMNGKTEAMIFGFALASTLWAFYIYNRYPASILPGDSLTYLAGAALFTTAVIGNMEKFALLIFVPWFLEFLLKLRSGMTAHSWGLLQEDGSLAPQHEKNYSLTHPLMRRGLNERQITQALMGAEAILCTVVLILFQTVLA
jgi:UDP-N-acetylglucosamine--dolichyl-phosphate N-acetylglucosaminephosphotransferase